MYVSITTLFTTTIHDKDQNFGDQGSQYNEHLLCRLLLDISSAEFRNAQPLEVEAFKLWQAECTEKGKAGLWTSWLPRCVEVFRRLLPIFINGNAEAYYSSIATLQVIAGLTIASVLLSARQAVVLCCNLSCVKMQIFMPDTQLESGFVCVQGNQLRQLVQDSLNSYVSFFQQYKSPSTQVNFGCMTSDCEHECIVFSMPLSCP